MQRQLAQIGLEPERVQMFNMSAAMAGEFVAAAKEMVQRVSALGPNPLRTRRASGAEIAVGSSQ